MKHFHHAGNNPQLSTGFFPQAFQGESRENTRTMIATLADRIRRRLRVLGISGNAGSIKCGMHRDYLSELLAEFDSGVTRHPRHDTLHKLASGLECEFVWLSNGEGPETPPADPTEQAAVLQEAWSIMKGLPEDKRAAALTVLRALNAQQTETGEAAESG
jgi:hypothetical protein